MSKSAVVFAGTIEGRQLAEFLASKKVKTTACVATGYGKELLNPGEFLDVQAGRMDEEAMTAFLKERNPSVVIDATHPYAAVVTENIRIAAKHAQVSYIRLLRQSAEDREAVYVKDTQEAIAYLNDTSGNILLTTGSKELSKYTKVKNFEERIYARVLSLPKVVEECAAAGFTGKHLICMQGPFSYDMNAAMLKQYDCKYLVTKEAGTAGGFDEKYDAAIACGAQVVVIGRPSQCQGMSVWEVRKHLQTLFEIPGKQEIILAGIGTAGKESATGQVITACEKAQLLIGAKRMLDAVAHKGQDTFCEYHPEKIADYIHMHPEYEHIVVVLSGDVGFYSGAKKLLDVLAEDNCSVLPGISSLVSFCAKLKTAWDDVKLSSLHGRQQNIIGMIREYPKVFSIVGTDTGVGDLCARLTEYGMGEVRISVGENLDYPNEKITQGKAMDMQNILTDPLCVLLVENESANAYKITQGIPDEEFLRDKVPMTKEEIRSVSIAKLQLNRDSVVYDIGAGTGSVSIEIARILTEGSVYAVEKNPTAVGLLHKNKVKFAVDNLYIVEGLAPESLMDLPEMTHAFIGGSSGNLREILDLLLKKNPRVRVVINAITLETVAETMDCLKYFEIEHADIASITSAKARALGRYHLMTGQNPVYVISFGGC